MQFLASLAFRRRGTILIVLGLFTLLAVLYGRGVARNLDAGGFVDPQSESSRADALLEERFRLGTPDVVVSYAHETLTVDDPAFKSSLTRTLDALRNVAGVERVSSPYGARPDALVSKDRHVAIISLRFQRAGESAEARFDAIAPKLAAAGLTHKVGGAIPAARQAQLAAERDLARAELITLPLVAVLLIVFFRGVVVALLPLLVGGFAVAAALASIRLLTHFGDVSIFAMNIVTFVGLGVAIDYSLFMTARFRDELAAGKSVEQAVLRTLETSGRTIAYSGAAVAVSLLSLFVFPLMLLRSVALAGSLVVVMALIGALLLLPAMLALLGHRISWLSLGQKRAVGARAWARLAEAVMRWPVAVTLVVSALLIVLGLPFLRVRPAVAGPASLPEDSQARQVAELIDSDRFPPEAAEPVQIFVHLDRPVLSESGLTALDQYVAQLRKLPNVRQIDAAVGGARSAPLAALSAGLAGPGAERVKENLRPLAFGQDAAVRVGLTVAPSSDRAEQAVHAVRKLTPAGMRTYVTSPAARVHDLKHALFSRLPWAFALIGLATFVVLFLAFGSLVMPIKAILMNVLSLTASFGALVFIFQEGRFERLLDFHSPGQIEMTVPVVMFAVVFGLAMDYELFLLSRIREGYDQTGDTRASVANGLARTGQLITRAALLLVAVMAGFISADMLLVKEMGVGMAVAVIVDATIVRALLVPASMRLLGAYNWWAPPRLAALWRRLHLAVDESEEPAEDPEKPRDSQHGGPAPQMG